MQPTVSLIVCIHNAESTLQRTLDSLHAQTFADVEYIFVDDGSTDRSVDLLQAFLALNPDFAIRHKLIRTNHGGSAHALRTGILNASGRYLMRCDADDRLTPDAVATMVAKADETGAEVVTCLIAIESPKHSRTLRFRRKPADLNDCAIDTLHFSVNNKLISRRLLTENHLLPFDEIDCWEDLGLTARVIALRPEIAYVDHPLYIYVQSPGSLSRSHKDRLLADHLKISLLLEDWLLHNRVPGEYDEFVRHLKFAAKVKMLRHPGRDVALWKRTFPEINSSILSLRHVGLHHRLLFAMVNLLPSPLCQRIADTFDSIFHPSSSSTTD